MVKKAEQATPNSLLRAARKERGWTQQEVADKIGSPHSLNVTRWERGIATPSAYYIQRLCQLFGKSASELGLFASEEVVSLEMEASSPSLWNVPYRRNPFFTGREDVLARLQEHLIDQHVAALIQAYSLTGLGGIGKTQIAIEYAYRFRQEYQAVFWVRAASQETLVADYVALARLVELAGQDAQDQSQVVAAVKRWLNRQEGWLLILDNADDLSLLPEFLPSSNGGHLLLTTRAQATGSIAPGLSIENLALEESMRLLLHRSGYLSANARLKTIPAEMQATALSIVHELDGLPLALDQAGAYIEECGCSLTGYLELYRKRWKDLLAQRSTLSTGYPHTVVSTWSLSFQQVERANTAAAELLRLFAFLDPDAIPEWLLTEGALHLGPSLSPVAAEPLLLNEALFVLRRYSLVRRQSEERLLSLHRLVQRVLRDQMDESMQRYWAERAMLAVNAAFPEIVYDTWARCQHLLPHAMLCAALIEQYCLVLPEAGRLLTYAGWYLLQRGFYKQAEVLFVQALTIREQVAGPDHPDTAFTLNLLGSLYNKQGRYAEAEARLQKALSIRECTLGAEHPDTAATLKHLGLTYTLSGQYAQGEPLSLRALAIKESIFGPEHLETADILNDLGQHYYNQGRYTEAEPLFLRALAVYKRTTGLEHPDAAPILYGLGSVYRHRGNYELATVYLRQALLPFEKLKDLDHPDAAYALASLAVVYLRQKKYEDAIESFQRSLAIFEKTLGPDHLLMALTLANLGQAYDAQERYEEAEPLHLRALAICERTEGANLYNTAKALYGLAQHYYLWGRYERAEAHCQRILTMCEGSPIAEKRIVASALHLLDQIVKAQGRT